MKVERDHALKVPLMRIGRASVYTDPKAKLFILYRETLVVDSNLVMKTAPFNPLTYNTLR